MNQKFGEKIEKNQNLGDEKKKKEAKDSDKESRINILEDEIQGSGHQRQEKEQSLTITRV